MRIFWAVQALAAAGAAVALVWYYWPLRLPATHRVDTQIIKIADGGVRIVAPDRDLIGDVADFDDALFAFLMYDYLRARPALADKTVMLTSIERDGQPVYRILVHLPNNLLEGVDFLAQLKAQNLTSALQYQWVLRNKFMSYLHQTAVFVNAYSGPASDRIEALHASELRGYLRRFIRFKSETDPRTSGAQETIPSPLTRQDASRLAADIIAVAQFYDIPVDLFLGIGAMENNYMNVAGDLKNTIWKRRAQPGDIVLKRRRGRVLVRNDSMGVWQITRESLRYAHKLYRKDKRDYTQLPERLRTPKKLELEKVDPEVLTTYAGLLLRDLLDRFHGDLALAAGAYNGGPGNPNAHYAAGVEIVASYARRVIGRAAEMNHAALAQNSVSLSKVTARAPARLEQTAERRPAQP